MKKFKLFSAIFGIFLTYTVAISAQSIVFSTLEGDKIDLDAQKGKVVVLAIGAQWLPLSDLQAGSLNKLAKKYANRDVVFYFISADSTLEKSKNYASNEAIRKFAKENQLSVTILRDSDGATSIKKFNIDQLPSFVILDKSGKVATEPFSGLDPKSDISIPLSKEIDKLL